MIHNKTITFIYYSNRFRVRMYMHYVLGIVCVRQIRVLQIRVRVCVHYVIAN